MPDRRAASIRPAGNLNEYLDGIQAALLQNVLPALEDAHAKSQLLAVSRILTRLIVNGSTAPSDFARAKGLWEQIAALHGMGALAAGNSPAHLDESVSPMADTPEQYFGGIDLHRAAEANLDYASTTGERGEGRCRDLLRWEAECFGRLRQHVTAVERTTNAVARVGSHEDIRGRLESYLRKRFPASPGLTVTELKVLPGGRSKLTALFKLAETNELPKKLVLRRDHPSHVTGTTVVAEFPVLAAAHAAGVAVPTPYFAEPSTEPLGGAFVVLGFVRGRRPCNPLGPLDSAPLALSFARQLARLHRIPLPHISPLFGESRRMTSQTLLAELQGVQKIWSGSNPPPSLAMGYAFQWLRRNLSLADASPVLVHGDASFHNVMASGPRLSALLDWEWAHLGAAGEDLGYCRPAVESAVEWRQFIDAYRRAGGPDVPQEQINFFSVWGRLRITTMIIAARALFLAGPARDLEFGHTAIDELYDWYEKLHIDLERTLSR